MRTYLSIFKMKFISGLQYRASAWSGIFTQLFFGAIMIMIYSAFYKSGGNSPMSMSEISTYIWLNQAFLAVFSLWFQDWELCFSVRDGDIAYEFIKPYDIYSFWFSRLIAEKSVAVLLRMVPIILIAFFIPKPYGMTLPPSTLSFVLSVLSLLLSFMLATSISMFVYIFLFRVYAAQGLITIISVISGFFSGALIPIPLMPTYMYKIVNLLPFRYLGDFPFRIYTGGISINEALFGIGMQVLWIICLIVIGKSIFGLFSSKITIQGG